MGEPRLLRARRAFGSVALAVLASAIVLIGGASGVQATGYPPLPGGVGEDRELLDNVSSPAIVPGGDGRIAFEVTAPTTPSLPLSGVVVTLGVYAFNSYPGTGGSTVPVAGAPLLTNATTSGENVSVTVAATLAPGASVQGSVGFATTPSTPAGTYAVRTAVAFAQNGTAYRLESRGWFNATTWAKATVLPNGSATLNLSVLGVSGVVAETGIVVSPSGWPVALAVAAAVGFALVGVGAWVYFRRSPGSTSGAG